MKTLWEYFHFGGTRYILYYKRRLFCSASVYIIFTLKLSLNSLNTLKHSNQNYIPEKLKARARSCYIHLPAPNRSSSLIIQLPFDGEIGNNMFFFNSSPLQELLISMLFSQNMNKNRNF
jgi:hypothetical protein